MQEVRGNIPVNAVTTLPEGRSLRVVAMVNNPCVSDARVIREAEALAEAGHEVLVLAHWALDVPEDQVLNGVQYKRIAIRPADRIKRDKSLIDAGVPLDSEEKYRGIHRSLEATVGERWISMMATGKRWAVGKEVIHRTLSVGGRNLLLPHWIATGVRYVVRVGYRYTQYTIQRACFVPRRTGTFLVRGARRIKKATAVTIITNGGIEMIRHARDYPAPATSWRPEIVHAHDLYTLLAGYRIARKTGAQLIYDSHELEVGRNGNYSKWEWACRGWSERFLVKRTDAVITVCDSIADFLRDLYSIPRPTVVHNAPALVPINNTSPDVRSHVGLSKDTPLALYVGSVTINRGLEQCVRALSYASEFHLVCVGPRVEAVEQELIKIATKNCVLDRLHFVDPLPHDQVTSFVRTADLSLILIQDVCLSYRFCFPNKLLESLLSGIPIVVSRLVELERLVEETGAGVVADQTDPRSIAKCMKTIMADRQSFTPSPEIIADLTSRFGLETQKKKLVDLYDHIGRKTTRK